MEKELLKQRLSVIADIAAIIIALTGTIYLLITLDPKYKLYLVCLLILIAGYIIINSNLIKKIIFKKNAEREIETIKKIDEFFALPTEELKKDINNLYDYLLKLQEVMNFLYIIPESYGFKSKASFPAMSNNYVSVSIQIDNLFKLNTSTSTISKNDKLDCLSVIYDDKFIDVKANEITLYRKEDKKLIKIDIDEIKKITIK